MLAIQNTADDTTLLLHQRNVSLAQKACLLELELAECLAEMEATGGYKRFAASMQQNAARVLGLGRGGRRRSADRTARRSAVAVRGGDLLRIGRRLEQLPKTRAAMAETRLSWTHPPMGP